MDRMADFNDMASKTEEDFKEDSLFNIRARLKAPSTFNGLDCIACDGEIPKDRLATGAWRCIHCQTLFERNKFL